MPCQLCGRWVVTSLPGQEWQGHGFLRGPPNGPSWGAYYRSEDGRVWAVAHRECARWLRLFAYAPLLRAAARKAGEEHKGSGKGKLSTAIAGQVDRSDAQRPGSWKGEPQARNKRCQCMCDTGEEETRKGADTLHGVDMCAWSVGP